MGLLVARRSGVLSSAWNALLGRGGRRAVAGAGTSSLTLSPTDKVSSVALSLGNLRATRSVIGASEQTSVRAAAIIPQGTGRFKVEMTANVVGASNRTELGVGLTTDSLTAPPVFANPGSAWRANGYVGINGGGGLGNPTFTDGDTISMEMDRGTGEVFYQKSGGSRFGPFTVSPTTGPFIVIVGLFEDGAQVTMNFGASAWVIPATAGYGPIPG